jgi:hypothetical protein
MMPLSTKVVAVANQANIPKHAKDCGKQADNVMMGLKIQGQRLKL